MQKYEQTINVNHTDNENQFADVIKENIVKLCCLEDLSCIGFIEAKIVEPQLCHSITYFFSLFHDTFHF